MPFWLFLVLLHPKIVEYGKRHKSQKQCSCHQTILFADGYGSIVCLYTIPQRTLTADRECVEQPMLSEWKDFHVLVEKTMPEFWNQLFSFKDFITDDEFKLCLLTRLSFTPSQIANLLGISKQSVTNRRRKLVKVLFNSTDSKSFDAFVKHINWLMY